MVEATTAANIVDYQNDDVPPLIVKADDVILMKRAIDRTGLSDKTIRRHFDRYRLGAKAGKNSPLHISLPGLVMVAHGDFQALELLRDGQRGHPRVARYLQDLGIPV